LHFFYNNYQVNNGSSNTHEKITNSETDSKMQELVQLVFQKSPNDIDFNIKNTFFTVARSFYYADFCDSKTINFHVAKVLFEKVL